MTSITDADPLDAQTGLDAAGRRERARKAAQARWGKTSEQERTETALLLREATLKRFEAEVDPRGELPADVRRELARAAWYEHIRTKARLRWARFKALEKAGLLDRVDVDTLIE